MDDPSVIQGVGAGTRLVDLVERRLGSGVPGSQKPPWTLDHMLNFNVTGSPVLRRRFTIQCGRVARMVLSVKMAIRAVHATTPMKTPAQPAAVKVVVVPVIAGPDAGIWHSGVRVVHKFA